MKNITFAEYAFFNGGKMKRKKTNILLGWMMLFLTLGMGSVHASKHTITLPITAKGNTSHKVTISSTDSPLPSTENLTLNNETKSFVIPITKADNYHYLITDDKGTTYHTTVVVTRNADGKMESAIYASKDGINKTDIIFGSNVTNNTIKQEKNVVSKKTKHVKTEDATSIMKYIVALFLSALALFYYLIKYSQNKRGTDI